MLKDKISDIQNQNSETNMGEILGELISLRADLIAAADQARDSILKTNPNYRESARNLLHYLALRRRDLRPMQQRLAALGLSSLGRSESHVLATVDAVLNVVRELSDKPVKSASHFTTGIEFKTGENLLDEHTEALLGPATPGRDVRIMVTMPTEAATDYTLVHNLLKEGMNCMRINCAHDDVAVWSRMIENLRRAEQSLDKSCKIFMDLAGPKLRTGSIEAGPAVLRIRPRRNDYGQVIESARIWLTRKETPKPPPSPANAQLSLPSEWLNRLQNGDTIELTDARGSELFYSVVNVTDGGCWLEANETSYLIPETRLKHVPKQKEIKAEEVLVGNLPAKDNIITLTDGDLLILTKDQRPGRPAAYDSSGNILTPPTIGCMFPEALANIKPGEPIWFDDGKIGGIVENVDDSRVMVRIIHAGVKGKKLKSDKGINLPESNIQIDAFTDKDLEDLKFVAREADLVGFSFVNSVRDVEILQDKLTQFGRQPAIVLKIETKRGFENLPALLLAAMRSSCCGVMIARGDLAVECGFERMAEIQEEILWISEAAHVPVIWATQVLENLAKKGLPSRAEISDAAMGHRAECVMLNKGPHILSAVRALDSILQRMQAHQTKKRSMLRELRLAHVRE